MLAIWGLITILGMIVAIASRRVSPLVALFLFPVTACLGGRLRVEHRPICALRAGIDRARGGDVPVRHPVFRRFTDAGTIEPFVKILLRGIGKNPVLIVPGTALLALLLHLDGSGAVVFLVAIPTLLPLYQELGMDRKDLGMRGIAGGRRELSAMDGTHNSRRQRTPHHSHSVVQASDSCSDRGPVSMFSLLPYISGAKRAGALDRRIKVHADGRNCDDRFSRFAHSLCLQFDSRRSSARPSDQRQS